MREKARKKMKNALYKRLLPWQKIISVKYFKYHHNKHLFIIQIGENILLTDFRWRDILPKSQKNVESLFWNFELLLYQRKQAGELPLFILQNAKKTEHLLLLFRVFAGRIVLMCLRELKKLRKSDPPKSQKVLMKFHA